MYIEISREPLQKHNSRFFFTKMYTYIYISTSFVRNIYVQNVFLEIEHGGSPHKKEFDLGRLL